MAAKTFTWRVERDVTPTIEFRTNEAQFGDGYKQVSADGINTKSEQYVIKTNARIEVARQIKAFFDELNGVRSFIWTPPLGTPSLFTCKDPTFTELGGKLYSFSGTFVKSFASMDGVQ